MSVCLSIYLYVRLSERPIVHDNDRSFLSDLPQIWNIGHTSDNEDQVRRSIKPEVLNAHVRQFTSDLAHFYACVHDIALPFLVRF